MPLESTTSSSWREIMVPQYLPALIIFCVAVWLHAADGTLVATMLPVIVSDIGGTTLLSWNVALYEVDSIVSGAISGLLASHRGVQKPLAIAAATFALGCILSATASHMWFMLIGRLVQGLGGGGLTALSFISIRQFFPEHLMPRAVGAVSVTWGVSTFLSPLIGGLFIEFGSWRTGFCFFALQAVFLSIWILIKTPIKTLSLLPKTPIRIPWQRLLLLFVGVTCIAFAGHEPSPIVSPLLVTSGFISLIAFVWLDSRDNTGGRMLPKSPLSLANPVGAALVMILCMCAATVTIAIYGPLLMAILHGASAMLAGYVIACTAIGWSAASIFIAGSSAGLSGHNDSKIICCGMTIVVLSISGFVYSIPNGPIWLIALFATCEGAGFGMCWTFILRRASKFTGVGEKERVTGAIPTVQRLGYALGAAYVGIIANAIGVEGTSIEQTRQLGSSIFLASIPLGILGLIAMWKFVHPHQSL